MSISMANPKPGASEESAALLQLDGTWPGFLHTRGSSQAGRSHTGYPDVQLLKNSPMPWTVRVASTRWHFRTIEFRRTRLNRLFDL